VWAVIWTWPVVWRFVLAVLVGAVVYRILSPLRPVQLVRVVISLIVGLLLFHFIRGDHPDSQGEWIMLGVLAVIPVLLVSRRTAPTFFAPPAANAPDAAKETRSPREFTSDESARLVDALDAKWGSTRPTTASLDENGSTASDAHEADGRQGIRAVHAHGSWATATFTPTTSRGSDKGWLSKKDVPLLSRDSIPALVRFSNFSGAADRNDGARQPHGMAIKLVDDEFAGMDLLGVDMRRFPVRTRDDFYAYMGLMTRNPLTRVLGWSVMALTGRTTLPAVLGTIKSPKRSYLDRTYNGLSTFCCFVRDPQGQSEDTPVRYRMVPTHPRGENTDPNDPRRLDTDLEERLRPGPDRGEIAFDIELVDGRRTKTESLGDPVDAWPKDQPAYQLGRLQLGNYLGDGTNCPIDAMTFNPHRLPTGMRPYDDEILMARRAAYPESHCRRTTANTERAG
jgi:catalase